MKNIYIYIAFILLFLGCKKDETPKEFSISTINVCNISRTTASTGGKIISDGGYDITIRGVCWGLDSEPTTDYYETNISLYSWDGDGYGNFPCEIKELRPKTTYYVRAYAVTSNGTYYGNQIKFTTLPNASVTNYKVSNITSNSATVGGIVTSEGKSEVLEKGICWNYYETYGLLTIDDYVKSFGSGDGSFTYKLTSLDPNTEYEVRAYARYPKTNYETIYGGINDDDNEVIYGETITFKTLP